MKPIDHTLADTQIGVGYGVTTLPHLRNLAIVGPFKVTGVSDNPARQKSLLVPSRDRPEDADAVREADLRARSRPRRIGVRRPRTDVAELMPFYQQGAARRADSTPASARSLQAMLSSLHFIFRVEEMPAGVRAGAVYQHR